MTLNEKQIQQLGYELISEFAEELFIILEKHLQEKHGPDWFSKSLKFRKGSRYRASKRDAHTIVHQIITERNNEWRGALASELKSPDYGSYVWRLLEKVLDSRNKWMHPDEPLTRQDLINLIQPIYQIFGDIDNALGDKCEALLANLRSGSSFQVALFSRAFSEEYSVLLKQNETLLKELSEARKGVELSFDEVPDSTNNGLSSTPSEMHNEIGSLREINEKLADEFRFYRHYSEGRLLSARLKKMALEFSILIGFVDEQIFFNYEDVTIEVSGKKVKPSKALDFPQMRQIMRLYIAEFASLINYTKDLKNEVGPENCNCKVCQGYGPLSPNWFVDLDLVSGSILEQMFNWNGFWEDSRSERVFQLVGEEFLRMQLEYEFSGDDMSLIFPEWSSFVDDFVALKENSESYEQIRMKILAEIRENKVDTVGK